MLHLIKKSADPLGGFCYIFFLFSIISQLWTDMITHTYGADWLSFRFAIAKRRERERMSLGIYFYLVLLKKMKSTKVIYFRRGDDRVSCLTRAAAAPLSR